MAALALLKAPWLKPVKKLILELANVSEFTTFAPPMVKLPVKITSIAFIVLEDNVLTPLIFPPTPLPVIKLPDTVKLPAVIILAVFCKAVLAIELAKFA